jgi:integrase
MLRLLVDEDLPRSLAPRCAWQSGDFPRYIDSHVRPLTLVQQKLGLRLLSHRKVGRHSVASQAVTGGESFKAVQAQLGHRSEQSTHKYSHLG